ncbi:hypothetical protein E3N88_10678 [Mikania micrantha]|uniref:Uncharacterized protein n=1 Tax=Mikania micrantha TaxID=192012 RepID=A0A5N6PDJ8_9ASTR|nr:hypothetical protein E3N88_10678 [Mikania micrantha]
MMMAVGGRIGSETSEDCSDEAAPIPSVMVSRLPEVVAEEGVHVVMDSEGCWGSACGAEFGIPTEYPTRKDEEDDDEKGIWVLKPLSTPLLDEEVFMVNSLFHMKKKTTNNEVGGKFVAIKK